MPLKKFEMMESKIINTVKEWLPWAVSENNSISEYSLLKNLAEFSKEQFKMNNPEKAIEVIKIINLIYSNSHLHEKNAIENEFLEVLSADESPGSLKKQLSLFPEKLKTTYLKNILEN